MSFKSDLKRITSQNTFFLHFTVSWVGSALSLFLISLCTLEVLSSVLISTPKLSLYFSLQSILVHGELSYLYLPLCCWDFWSPSSSGASPILPFGFDFPARHLSCKSVLVSLWKWAANLWRSLEPRSHCYLFLAALKVLSWAFNKSTCLQRPPPLGFTLLEVLCFLDI